MNATQHEEVISRYTVALSPGSDSPQDLLMKRSNAWVAKGAQEDALNDAKEWARFMLASDSCKYILAAGLGVSILLPWNPVNA